MGYVETTTTLWARPALTAVAPANGASAKPWLIPGANRFATGTAMHPTGSCRPPEAPT